MTYDKTASRNKMIFTVRISREYYNLIHRRRSLSIKPENTHSRFKMASLEYTYGSFGHDYINDFIETPTKLDEELFSALEDSRFYSKHGGKQNRQ